MNIEKNVPIPDSSVNGRPQKYPEFRRMDVGDSVVFAVSIHEKPSASRPAVAAKVYGIRSGKKFLSRVAEPGVLRIWRTQ